YTGDEFASLGALRAGYDGIIAGGGAIIAPKMRSLFEAHRNGRYDLADSVDSEITDFLRTIYGGEGFPSWLTGLKYGLVRMGLISSIRGMIEFPVLPEAK